MDDHAREAKEWRDRAIALRALAKHMTHPTARDELMQVASRWDERAEDSGSGIPLLRRFDRLLGVA